MPLLTPPSADADLTLMRWVGRGAPSHFTLVYNFGVHDPKPGASKMGPPDERRVEVDPIGWIKNRPSLDGEAG